MSETIDDTEEEMTDEVAAYIRVSSREQAMDTHALDQQRARVISAGAQQVFEDVQKGRSKKRPSFQKLIELVKRGKIRKIIITRIDRASRSIVDLKEFVKVLSAHDVTLVVLDQDLDLGTAQGKMWLNLLGMLAEWEVDLLSERVKHGKEHQRLQGWASGSCPWGYNVVDHKYVLDQTPFLCLLSDRPENYVELSQSENVDILPRRTIAQLARHCIDILFEKKGANRALKVIFEEYGIVKTGAKVNGTDKIFHWTIRGFTVWLNNPILDGHTCYGKHKTVDGKRVLLPREEWQIVNDTHPDQRILQDGEAAAIHTLIQTNTRNGSGFFQTSLEGQDNYRPFAYQTGLIYCGECGSRCTPKGCHTGKYLYHACRHAGVGCNNRKSVKRISIEEALIEALLEKSCKLNNGESGSETVLSVPAETVVLLEKQLAGLEQIPGFLEDVEELKTKLRQQIEEEKNPFLSPDKVFDSSVEDLIRAGNNLAIWHLLDNDEKVEIYPKLVKKIYIRDGKVTSIVFNQ